MPSIFKITIRNRRLEMFSPDAVQAWRDRDEDPTLSTAGVSYDPLHKLLWQDHSASVLPALMHYGDAISMAHSVESRNPFMDYRLIEWVFSALPELLKNGETKTLVRSYLNRQNFHATAARQDKKGYAVPMAGWYNRFGKKYLSEITTEPSSPIWNIVDRKHVAKSLRDGGSERKLFHQYKLVTIDIWLREMQERRSAQA
jgi:asparagine synthase (glutamine-hydrolysing)